MNKTDFIRYFSKFYHSSWILRHLNQFSGLELYGKNSSSSACSAKILFGSQGPNSGFGFWPSRKKKPLFNQDLDYSICLLAHLILFIHQQKWYWSICIDVLKTINYNNYTEKSYQFSSPKMTSGQFSMCDRPSKFWCILSNFSAYHEET